MHLTAGPLAPNTCEVGLDARCDSPCGPGSFPEELFTASYGRQTADSLHNRPPSDTTDLPRPPQPTLQPLEPSMTIEGSFTATPGTLSDQVM